MSCPAQELPQDLWTKILQHVDYQERLSACALVCRKLARAAAAATTSLDSVCCTGPQQLEAFLAWTNRHGSSLTKLRLSVFADHTPVRQLPCPNLLKLDLWGSAQLCASSEHLGLLHSCTALTSLCLRHVTLLDGDVGDGAAGAAPAARLQYLQMDGRQRACHEDQQGKLAQALHDRLFPHLTSLSELALGGRPQICCTGHISTLVGLGKLCFRQGPLTTTTLPGIEHLTALKDLDVLTCDLEPACLLPMTAGLTSIHLAHLSLLPQQHGTMGTSQLLQVLARLTALRKLELHEVFGDWAQQQLSAYSALTASSSLQELRIYDCDLPTTAWAHVFPAGRKLLHLHKFSGSRSGVAFDDESAPEPFDSTAIQRLASCCPGLQDACIDVCAGASLAPLAALLTALTCLWIGPVGKPAAIVHDLEPLSSLRELHVSDTVPFPGPGEDSLYVARFLLPLTALTQITCLGYTLEVEVGQDSDVEVDDDQEMFIQDRFTNKAPAGARPDVWVQLLRLCARHKRLQPSVTDSMVQLLQHQRQQLAQQAAQIQEQQQQLEAAQAEAAELRGLVQSLPVELPVAGLQQLQL